ncbi:FMRFamide receptor-like [Plakobranchus ocellatus]|uniref:FMRFamide receptor-like n=1 Tax=Plakobranchus ocellatus TaxID=259542 RepID=A0AAV4CQZ1_9GAST|nr:FMRFamide receptor-like [Plakobranchus ocellatus]
MITAAELQVIVNFSDVKGSGNERNVTLSSPYGATPAADVNVSQTIQGPPFLCNYTAAESADLSFYLNGVSTAVVIILGVLGNAMAVMVLTRRTMRSSTNVFLTALAIWDTLVLLVVLLLICLIELSEPFRQHAFPYIVVYLYPVGLAAQTATVWLTVSFTVERYIAVCHPLKAASMCSIPRARIVVLTISLVSILYNLPRWFEYSIVNFTDSQNETCIFPGRTPLANDSIYHKIYFGWLYFLVMCFIPLCSLAVLNSFLIVAVRRSKRERRSMNVKESRENNVTIMLVSVVIVFIICQVPALIYNMAYSINMPEVSSSYSWDVLSNFRNFLVTLNSAVNFILYCALGQKFRRTFVRTLCPCLVQRMPGRFQSFSFNHKETKLRLTNHRRHNSTNSFHGQIRNGSAYPGVGYRQCRTEKEPGLDMKVLRQPYSARESSESAGSECGAEPFSAGIYQRSNLKLLPTTVGSKIFLPPLVHCSTYATTAAATTATIAAVSSTTYRIATTTFITTAAPAEATITDDNAALAADAVNTRVASATAIATTNVTAFLTLQVYCHICCYNHISLLL